MAWREECQRHRVSAMIFGPKKLIEVGGVNKIERNVEEA